MDKTPLIMINGLLVKMEYYHFTGSIKDRNAQFLIDNYDFAHYVVASSGNFAIAAASYSLTKQKKCTCFVSEKMSKSRLHLLKLMNVEIYQTASLMESIKQAKEYATRLNAKYLDQFDDVLSVIAHFFTAKEIMTEVSELDYFVCGIGSGSTISGVGRVLKSLFPKLKIIGVKPKDSRLEGIGAGFKPCNEISSLIDEYVEVDSDEVLKYHQDLIKMGYLLGYTAAANLFVASKYLPNKVLTIVPDHIFKYLEGNND